MKPFSSRLGAAALALVVILAALALPVGAQTDSTSETEPPIVIDLGDVTISDLDLRGPGLPDEHIDERTYSIGDFDVEIDGISVTADETDYRFGHVSIDVEPFDVIVEDVTLDSGE